MLSRCRRSYGASYSTRELGPLSEGVGTTASAELFTLVSTQSAADDVLIFRRPRALALFTGRRASVYHTVRDDGELLAYMDGIGARYLVTGPEPADDGGFLREFAERHPERFERVLTNADYRVYGARAPS